MEALGYASVAGMVSCYAFEHRGPGFVLGFAAACAAAALYAVLVGTWPFALAEAIWCGLALRRWQVRKAAARSGGGGDWGPPAG